MSFTYNDGGRTAAGYQGKAGDCVCRAIAIAAQLPYADVYKVLASGMGSQRKTKRTKRQAASARNGIYTRRKWFKDYMGSLGFTWTATMRIGTGCTTHLDAKELPRGRLVVAVSRHYTTMIDGVVHDTFDPRREESTEIGYFESEEKAKAWGGAWVKQPDGRWFRKNGGRCVYGYWSRT